MKKITIKKGDDKVTIPPNGIFVNGFIIKANASELTVQKTNKDYKEKNHGKS